MREEEEKKGLARLCQIGLTAPRVCRNSNTHNKDIWLHRSTLDGAAYFKIKVINHVVPCEAEHIRPDDDCGW